MKIAIYGGSFNPPHLGHLISAQRAFEQLNPDVFLIMPTCEPPHKSIAEGSPTADRRLEMCEINFASLPRCRVSDMELYRGGKSYTADTVDELKRMWPDAELCILMGTDMFLSLETWHRVEHLIKNAVIGVFQREKDELGQIMKKKSELERDYNARIELIDTEPFPVSSSEIRDLLPRRAAADKLESEVYRYIVKNRFYGVRLDFSWLREQAYGMLNPKRVPHVKGCEEEAVRLARHWGAQEDLAAEAGILHDVTKKLNLEEQLLLCEEYDIIIDGLERKNEKLLHSKTGAAVAEHEFGCCPEVCDAIRWHTTGKEDMTLLEKIIYMADYIEPNRSFEGVDELRRLAYEDIDSAMVMGLQMSIDDVIQKGNIPHSSSLAALNWYKDIKR